MNGKKVTSYSACYPRATLLRQVYRAECMPVRYLSESFSRCVPVSRRDVVSVWVSDQYIFVQKTFANSPDRFRAMALSNGFA
jgi:hypothetical protein